MITKTEKRRRPSISALFLGHVGALLGAWLLAGCATDSGRKETDVFFRPELTRSVLEAAAMAASQNDHATAATYYRNVYSRDPNNVRAAIGLMQSLRELGAINQAREVADRAIATKTQDSGLIAESAKVKLASGQVQEAVRLLEQAIALDAADWKAHSALGVAYDRLGDSTRAGNSYHAALKISPENAVVLNNYALSRAMAKDLNGARELLQRAIASAGADVRVRQNLALIYALSGDIVQAEALTLRDLPPELARETLAYYRELAAKAQSRP